MSDARETIVAALADLGVDSVDPGLDLLESGLLDSLALVSLIAELEERLDIHIPFEGLDIDDFRTIESIAGVVEGRQGSAAASREPSNGGSGS